MKWTTTSDLRQQVERLWERGRLLSTIVDEESIFPLRLKMKKPSTAEIAHSFPKVREWIEELKTYDAKYYRIEWRKINHRVMGRNSFPKAIWLDKPGQALEWIGKKAEADCFAGMIAQTRRYYPQLISWLAEKPLQALEISNQWSPVLQVIDWMVEHPRPNVYLRQIDIPGIHTKFIECHRGVLAELLNLVLEPDSISDRHTGVANFCRRFGFLDKPRRIRFRILDSSFAILDPSTDQDISLNQEAFSKLELPVRRVFITENEINYLAFPKIKGSIVIFGSGYGFDVMSSADWLEKSSLHYWGDIDTHGFAILDQLRSHYDHVQSFLMDRETLLKHRVLWGVEPKPETRALPRLTNDEKALYQDLRNDRFGHNLRLEQEHISYSWVRRALSGLS